jgi:hypothetical protein
MTQSLVSVAKPFLRRVILPKKPYSGCLCLPYARTLKKKKIWANHFALDGKS